MSKVFADIHCHPSMKPYGKSFQNGNQSPQSALSTVETSAWYKKKPTILMRAANEVAGLTVFTQSDYQSLQQGNVRFVCSSLYPVEKGFVATDESVGKKLIEFVMGIGLERINNIQNHDSYFKDVMNEYECLRALNDTYVEIGGQKYVYRILKSGKEIERIQELYSSTDVVLNVLTIEGAHALDCGLPGKVADENKVLENVKAMRNWEHRPFFITLAHHFYNELCGHAKSLHLPLQKKLNINQDYNLNTGITDLGSKVIEALLDNHDGRRILIDIKHMSRKSRLQYFDMASKYGVPLVASHAGVTGLKDETKSETISGASANFVGEDINFYDDELIAIANSSGLIGIQLDERRIASSDVLHRVNFIENTYRWEKWAYLLWRQIQHVGEVLDSAGLPAWDYTCIGSDFDGLINPIGPFWTAAEMSEMQKQLEIGRAHV